jgi:hypothetical protein
MGMRLIAVHFAFPGYAFSLTRVWPLEPGHERVTAYQAVLGPSVACAIPHPLALRKAVAVPSLRNRIPLQRGLAPYGTHVRFRRTPKLLCYQPAVHVVHSGQRRGPVLRGRDTRPRQSSCGHG